MNANYRRVPARFDPETRFEVRPLAVTPFWAAEEHPLETLKRRLLAERLEEVWDAEMNSLIRRAANEAATLAWMTAFPLLVFPALFEEKIAAEATKAARQSEILARSRDLMAA